MTDGKREKSNNDGHCDGVTGADRGFAPAANGKGAANHRCDHCGMMFGEMNPWDWPGRPVGIWLHPRCEEAWFDSEGRP